MNAPEVAAQIRADAFAAAGQNLITAPSLAASARILAAGLAKRIDQILAGKPWYWRILFAKGFRFAVDVLNQVATQIAGDYEVT